MPIRRLACPRRALALVATVMLAVIAVLGAAPAPVGAHNTLLSSDPADGAVLDTAPERIVWVFDLPVPLETMTVTLIAADGSRTELSGSTHGPSGEAEVVTPLPDLADAAVSVRWRLVGADGHAITGRIGFTIASTATAASTPPGSTSLTPAPVAPVPVTSPATATDSTGSTDSTGTADTADAGVWATPSAFRWLLRYGSYLAILAVLGVLLTSAFVWSGAGERPALRRLLGASLLATAVLGVLQLLVLASDISGDGPWAAFGSVDAATTTDAGMALAIRIALALTLWVVLFRSRIAHADVYWTAVSLAALGLLATWAFAGHARSMRWPAVGVTVDVVHHAAAALWIGGLAIVGWVAIPTTGPDALAPTIRRFSTVAAACVAVLVFTGLVQGVRLIGDPTAVFDTDHGRYLAAKLAALAVMLGLAAANRRRLRGDLDTLPGDAATGPTPRVHALRRSIVGEFTIGLVIIAITAAMVVSPPATADPPAPRTTSPTSPTSPTSTTSTTP